MPNVNLSQFFLLPNLVLENYARKGNSRFIHLYCQYSPPERPNCLHCGHKEVHIHQRYIRKIKDAPLRASTPILVVKLRRFRCRLCRRTFNEQIPGVLRRARLSERMQRHIAWACENFADLKKVQHHTSCSSKTIYKRYYTQLELKQRERMNDPWPKTVGIDEHAFTRNKERGHRDFVTMLVDYKNRRPKEVVPCRNAGQLEMALKHIPGRKNVKNVVMDLSATYRSFAKDFFPNAIITSDHFHVVRLLHPAINRRRKQLIGDKRKHPLRKLLLKNGHKLEVHQQKAIWRWLDEHPDLKAIYTAKEALHTLYRCRGYNKARRSLINLCDWLAAQKIPELQTLRRTLMRWREEILNYFKTKLTNAKTEGFNNVAKSIIKRAYGFRNFANYRLRVLNA